MTVRQIVFTDNPVLRQKSRRVPQVTREVERLIADMFETMHQAGGVGLAAVQVGVPLRVIVVEIPEDMDDPDAGVSLAMINPEFIRTVGEKEEGTEGCLSVPGWAGKVPRYPEVVVKWLGPDGKAARRRARGYLARVLQHEIDHTNGVLFIDLATEVWSVEEGQEETAEMEDAERRGAAERLQE